MDDDSLQRLLRDQMPGLAAPTTPPPNARARVRQAVTRRRRRVRATVGTSVAGALALVILLPLGVFDGWGSDDSGDPADSVGQWRPIAASPLSPRGGSASVWTGEEMIVVGGNVGPPCPPTASCTGPRPAQLRADGAAYDPDTDTWRSIAPAPVPFVAASTSWTGHEMVVLGTGRTLAYNPETDTWRELDAPPDALNGGAWDGHELVFWQSEERTSTADWSLDPSTGRWTKLPPDPFEPTYDRAYVWTGDRFVFVGIDRPSTYAADDGGETFQVAEYDPTTRTWQRLPDSPVGGGGVDWFFHQGYVVDPYEDPYSDDGPRSAGAYDPATRAWSDVPRTGLPETTQTCGLLPAIGSAGDWIVAADGVLYSLDPADTIVAPDCPQLPEPVAGAWTGQDVLLWGGPARDYKANSDLGLVWTPPPAG